MKTNFKTREKTWYNSLFAPDVPSGTVFIVPEGASKQFHDYVYDEDAPIAKYQQDDRSSCCFSSLASAFYALGDTRAEMAIGSRILESLTVVPVPYKTRIAFALDVLQSKKHVRKPNEPRLRLGVQGVKNIASINLFSDLYNGARIVQLEDILGNQSHCITIAGRWIFDSNFERALPLCIESFHM